MDAPLTSLPCPFEKAILSRTCACRFALRTSVATRLKVQCSSVEGHQDCADILNHIRKHVNFSLGLAHVPNALPQAQAAKLQCGVLIGLQKALDKVAENNRVNNIYDTVQRALKRYGSLQALPDQDIIRSIASSGK